MSRDTRLIWIDLEMTGLDPVRERIIEMAIIVTDADLNTLAESPVLVVNQPDSILDAMDEWNTIEKIRPCRGLTRSDCTPK